MSNSFNIAKLFSLITLIFLTVFCNAQGGWNIGYLKVDSINKSHIGRIVRIDFKSTNNKWLSPGEQRYIRSYVGIRDTGIIIIDTSLFVLAERRKIYADHGDYSDQFLQCLNIKQKSIFIYDAKIINLNEQSIEFQFDLEIKKPRKLLKKETKVIHIDKNKLDGVMYKL